MHITQTDLQTGVPANSQRYMVGKQFKTYILNTAILKTTSS